MLFPVSSGSVSAGKLAVNILEVSGLNLGRVAGYFDQGLSWFFPMTKRIPGE
jgi:hypothetical protein